jgi:hypothetical protein
LIVPLLALTAGAWAIMLGPFIWLWMVRSMAHMEMVPQPTFFMMRIVPADSSKRGYHADGQTFWHSKASPNAPDTALVCIKSVREGERVSSHYLHYCTIAELQQKVGRNET